MSRDSDTIRIIRADKLADEAIDDLVEGLQKYEIWTSFALHEIRQRFRRSILGPFWLTLSMGILVAALGVVFSTLLGQDIGQTLPYISVGLIFWGLLTSVITDGTAVFIGSESFIKNVPIPISVHLYRMITKNMIIWGFNMVIYLSIVVLFTPPLNWHSFLFIPGFLLFFINFTWMGLAIGILSTRYRDIPQVIASAIQVTFFVTPVFWSVDSLPNHPAFVKWNPFYHMLEIVRAPLIGNEIALSSWIYTLVLAAVGLWVTAHLYRRSYARIAYWV